MNNPLRNNRTDNVSNPIQSYFRFSYRRFFGTPERALEKAYNAALAIKLIEDEYFNGQTILEKTKNYSKTVLDCFISDLNKNLNLIKINLWEFKVSRFLLTKNNYNPPLEKLVFIDKIVEKYTQKSDREIDNLKLVKKTIKTSDRSKVNLNGTKESINFMDIDPIDKKTGVLPRSLGRTWQKLKDDLDDNTEEKVVQNFRRSRKLTKLAIRTFLLMILVPLLVQQLTKDFIFLPAIERNRDNNKTAIFMNYEMQEEALKELQIFEERLNFEALIGRAPNLNLEEKEDKLKEKARELAVEFKEKSNIALSNVFADILGLTSFAIVAFSNKTGIAAIKTLLDSVVYDLSDSAKAFIIILSTDIFVGFHSPHGWEVLLEGVATHLGLVANHSAIFLFIATFPVVLDTIFKYWIFRYLNRISPSAVATLKEMNE
ncbi:MAG: proton extrusion protein PcxA [Xenococcaceae cyanobacterium]